MNTRQKLTLGIVAIFMVTLTIVGVTYAYFVTQVTGLDSATDVDVKTATFGSVQYVGTLNGAGVTDIEMTDVTPGTEGAKKTFKFGVKNTGNEDQGTLTYSLVLENKEKTTKRMFLQTVTDQAAATVDKTSACYFGTADENAIPENVTLDETVPSDCVGGKWYDNIYVTIERYADNDSTFVKKHDTEASTFAKQRLSSDSLVDIKKNIEIEAGDTHYYIVTVEYLDAGANQNYETTASLEIQPDIR